MAVQVWVGEKPEHANERRAIVALANGLERLDGLYLLLANFSVGGRNIDLVVVKQDGIFIIELKHCDGKVFGDVNGPWYVEGSNGERKRLNPGRKNPYNQVISYYYSLMNFLNERRGEFLSAQKARSIDFRTCRRLVVISPTLQEGSQVETDWKVELKGLDTLPIHLVTERSSEIDLSEAEMLAIPEMLSCIRWTEINTLIAGVVPAIVEPASPEPAVEPIAAPVSATDAPAQPPARRLPPWLTGWPARVGGAVAAIALLALLALLLRPPAAPIADQPGPAVVSGTTLPAGGENPDLAFQSRPCVWSEYQAIGRKRTDGSSWQNVGVSNNIASLAPDVVITLEQVDFCGDRIELTWSVRNNGDQSVVLPLTATNIAVKDSLGNAYLIAGERSQPTEILAPAKSRAEGKAVIARAANTAAQTLVVKLISQPFGEATWLVPNPLAR